MKIFNLILILMLSSNLYSYNEFNDKNIDSKKEIQKRISLAKVKKLFSDFEDITGETKLRFNSLISESYKKDLNFLKAIDSLLVNDRNISIDYYDMTSGETTKLEKSIPNYPKILELLHTSVKKHKNVLSAYLGASIIGNRILLVDKNGKWADNELKDLVRKHYPIFIYTLAKNNYCYGYMLGSIYYDNDSYYGRDKERYNKYLNLGLPVCKAQLEKNEIPKFLYRSLIHKKVRDDAHKILEARRLKRIEEKKKNEEKLFLEQEEFYKKELIKRDLGK